MSKDTNEAAESGKKAPKEIWVRATAPGFYGKRRDPNELPNHPFKILEKDFSDSWMEKTEAPEPDEAEIPVEGDTGETGDETAGETKGSGEAGDDGSGEKGETEKKPAGKPEAKAKKPAAKKK